MGLFDGAKKFIKGAANKAVSLASHVPGARNVGSAVATGIGAVTPAVGGLQKFRDAAFTVSHNATNPNVNILGRPNPSRAPAPAPSYPQQVQGVYDPGYASAGGVYSGAGGGGARGGGRAAAVEEYDPNLDPAKIGQARGEVTNLQAIFDQAFQDAMAQVDVLAAEKKKMLAENYGKQRETLQGNYATSSGQIDNIYSARGAFNSSYREGEQATAKKAFEDAMTGLSTAEQSDMGEIGQFATAQKASLGAARPNYNVNDYNNVADLLDVKQAVDEAVKQIGVTRANLGTTSEYATNLNKITPTQEAGSSALKAQLDRLASVNAPADAKRAIAAQAIGDASPEQEGQWLDYFDKLLAQQGSQAVAA